MEILRSSLWLPDRNPISTSAKSRWRSPPRMVPSNAVRMAVADTNSSGNGERLEAGVADLIRSGVVSDGSKPWWAPLFFYNPPPAATPTPASASSPSPSPSKNGKTARNGAGKKSNVVFTAEKARLLRRELRAAEGWEDDSNMYRSPVASRLAFRLPKNDSP